MSVERETIGNTARWYWSDDSPKHSISKKEKNSRREKNKSSRKARKITKRGRK